MQNSIFPSFFSSSTLAYLLLTCKSLSCITASPRASGNNCAVSPSAWMRSPPWYSRPWSWVFKVQHGDFGAA